MLLWISVNTALEQPAVCLLAYIWTLKSFLVKVHLPLS